MQKHLSRADIRPRIRRVARARLVPGTGTIRDVARPSKGPRVQLKVRVPDALHSAMAAAAARQGKTLNDYLGEMLARDTGVPYYPSAEEQLPQSA